MAHTGSALQEQAAAPCVTCGTAYATQYCPRCGEKRVDHHDYSLAHFAEHAFESFTHLDFKILRSLRVLLLQPGVLTREYLQGRRRPFAAPVQLFIIANVLFALLIGYTGFMPFNTPLHLQESNGPLIGYKQERNKREIERRGVSRAEFERAFNTTAKLQSKTLPFAMIPAFALGAAVLYGFRRYFVEHLVLATHFYAFLLLLILAIALAWRVLGPKLLAAGVPLSGTMIEESTSLLLLAAAAAYLWRAQWTAFGGSPWRAAVRGLVLASWVVPVLLAYRLLLFFMTLWALG